ncbi:PrsW family glutamic-type intramembrane protease [Streptomyces sp. CCM_MD2014]|uniref:PrsW family glutamic-type intramembrane protease n=1 Tax=Streptomyces sp. CCM_MD2014 TaxID=1561022 RepID=UPI002D2187FE|nr:PrsW family glutamic-type intramembrane protease [Streptomyces sp. CCM_MD2014]
MMAVAAVWGVLQLYAVSWPTRSVRLSTVLLAVAVGVYGCGVATAVVELAYTRLYADQSGQSLITVVNTTSYTVAPWAEELIKIAPLLLVGCSRRVRRQWGLSDFTVLGGALGAGFGLLEAVLRFGLDADRAIARGEGWIIPDSLSPSLCPRLGPGAYRLAARTVQPTGHGRTSGHRDVSASGAVDPRGVRGRTAVGYVRVGAPVVGGPLRCGCLSPHGEQLRGAGAGQ